MKNIVFIPFIERNESYTYKSGVGKLGRTGGYDYGINSWRNWCNKNNCELVIMNQLLMPESEMLITWQRWYVLDILEHNNIDYEQVLIVDADSIVHPNCPNFFNMTNGKFSSPLTDGDYEWVSRALNGYSKMFFNKEYCIPTYEFFQTGFVIVNKRKRFYASARLVWRIRRTIGRHCVQAIRLAVASVELDVDSKYFWTRQIIGRLCAL